MEGIFSHFFFNKVKWYTVRHSDFEVTYLRKSEKYNAFVMPNIQDVASVNKMDIVLVLPQPMSMKTKRLSGYVRFEVRLDLINVW